MPQYSELPRYTQFLLIFIFIWAFSWAAHHKYVSKKRLTLCLQPPLKVWQAGFGFRLKLVFCHTFSSSIGSLWHHKGLISVTWSEQEEVADGLFFLALPHWQALCFPVMKLLFACIYVGCCLQGVITAVNVVHTIKRETTNLLNCMSRGHENWWYIYFRSRKKKSLRTSTG